MLSKKQREEFRDTYGEDISELSGDPWAKPGSIRDELPDAEIMKSAHENLERWVSSLPAGSLTGGQIVEDDFSQDTWKNSSDPQRREVYALMFGNADPSTLRDGLSASERQAAYAMGEKGLASTTQADLDEKQENMELNHQARDAAWAAFQLYHPDAAQDHAGSARAFQQAVSKYQGDQASLRQLLAKDPKAIADAIANEYADIQYSEPAQSDQSDSPHIDYGSGYGGGSYAARSRPDDAQTEDIADQIGQWQKSQGLV